MHPWHEVGDGVFVRRYPFLDQTIGAVVGLERVLVIDTRATRLQARELIRDLRQLTQLPWVAANTHAHFDHAGGVDDDWKNVYLHKDDFFDGPYFKIPARAKEINFKTIQWGKFEFEILHTPGHTLGSICLFEREKGVLISGDTLFADGIGRTDLGGDEKLMVKSLFRLRKLGWRVLCPGHGETCENRC